MEQASINLRESVPSGPVPTVLEAIVRRLCVVATYNRGSVVLAPHVLYTRHDVLHLDAMTLLRDGRAPREQKIATYRFTGLTDIGITDDPFMPSGLFEPDAERYRGVTLLAVEAQ
ncbi:MAG: hypothetical protein ACKVOB_01745 [Sphingomonas sp.]